jgi:putative transposase
MTRTSPFRLHEIIRLAVTLYVRFPLSLGEVEDLLHVRAIEVSQGTVRFWWMRFGPMFAVEIGRRRMVRMRSCSRWRWQLDERFAKVNGAQFRPRRAVDHRGGVLEASVSKARDKGVRLRS